MGVFEALKNGFGGVAKNLKLWVLLIVVSIVLMLISIPVLIAVFAKAGIQPGVAPTPEQMAMINWPLFVVFVIFMFIVQTFVNAGVVGNVKDIVKTQACKLGDFPGYAKKFFLRFILFTIIIGLIMLGVIVVFALLGSAVGIAANAVRALGIILGIILAIAGICAFAWLGVYGSFGPVIMVAEDKGAIEALGEAFSFVKSKLWPSVGLAVILWILFVVVAVINNLSVYLGPASVVIQIIASLINVYLSLVYILSFMSFYLGNKEGASSAGPAA